MKKLLLLMAVLLLTLQTKAQTTLIEDVLSLQARSVGYIIGAEGLAGYYSFYEFDKVSKTENSYILMLHDNSLNLIKKITINRPKNDVMIEIVFNGENFLIAFLNKSDLELVVYDKDGIKLGSRKQLKLGAADRMVLVSSDDSEEKNNIVFGLGKLGFLKNDSYSGKKEKYRIEAYDNSMKNIWAYTSRYPGKATEIVEVLAANENVVALSVSRVKNRLSKDITMSIILLDAKNGNPLLEKELKDGKAPKTLINAFVDTASGEVVFGGEYFAAGENVVNGKPLGIYFERYNFNGDSKGYHKLSWTKDFSKFQKSSKTGKAADGGYTFFHRMFKTSNGDYVLVGEQFKSAVSASGVALNVAALALGGRTDAGLAKFVIMDMVFVNLDSNFSLKAFERVEKTQRNYTLAKGWEFASSAAVAKYMKANGFFDYAFSSVDYERNRVFASYANCARRKDTEDKKKTDYIGALVYDNGELSTDKLPIKSKGTWYHVMPAKPGYLVITIYEKKAKTLEMQLEKINF